MDKEKRIEELLKQISDNPKYDDALFLYSTIYFKIIDDEIFEIPSNYSETARGDGGNVDTFYGPTKEENDYMEKLMKELDFDEFFFSELMDEYYEFDEEIAREYFELDYLEDVEWDEEEEMVNKARTYLAIVEHLEKDESPFTSICEFVEVLKIYGCESDVLYYEYEGEILEFEDSLCNSMEERGTYEDFTDEEWISILENIDNYLE